MSTTLSTQTMVAELQRKTGLGLSTTDCMNRLNEAFRKIDQMSQGGFVWQIKQGTLVLPAGAATVVDLPTDFDPGKKAVLYGAITVTPTATEIPYMPFKDFVNQQHFPASQIAGFAAWTFFPTVTGDPPTAFKYSIKMAPDSAFPLAGGGVTLRLFYHRVNFQPFTIGASTYFPTPDQFDTFIMDLAEAEIDRIYGKAGWDKIAAQATQALSSMIDTYRTDRVDLAGIADQTMQIQEKQAERAR